MCFSELLLPNQNQAFVTLLLMFSDFFAIKPTPVLGGIPNGKKYFFFPKAWFKIPNLRKIPSQAHICNQNLYMYCQKLQLVNQSDTYENE